MDSFMAKSTGANKRNDENKTGLGIKINEDTIDAFVQAKKIRLQQEAEQAKAEAEEKARQERLENPTTEDLLKDIRDILRREGK